MSIGGKIVEISQAVNDLVLAGANSKITKKVVGGAAKGIRKGVNAVAGGADKSIKVGQAAAEKISDPAVRNTVKQKVSKGVGSAIKNTITDESSYSAVRLGLKEDSPVLKARNIALNRSRRQSVPIATSNKFLIGDDIHRRVKTGLDSAAHILGGDSLLTGRKALITTGGDNLLPLGMKATGMGVAVAGAVNMGLGTPQAVEQWNKNRQGTNYDSQPVTSAPKIPAYANNGGATGDLVFALNNLRNGGMF